MADTCKGVEYSTTIKEGTYGSRWFKCNDGLDKGSAIEAFMANDLKKDGKAQDPCTGDCKDPNKAENRVCQPISIKIHPDEGDITFKPVEQKVRKQGFCSYLLVVHEDSTITVTTKCDCLTYQN